MIGDTMDVTVENTWNNPSAMIVITGQGHVTFKFIKKFADKIHVASTLIRNYNTYNSASSLPYFSNMIKGNLVSNPCTHVESCEHCDKLFTLADKGFSYVDATDILNINEKVVHADNIYWFNEMVWKYWDGKHMVNLVR